ncbi:right-handed parallel beta-helix repeat-containing protein, partial [bacterium]|nr:right-handed parallel beta-helix repeat-containing protein [bacterium]
LQLMLRDDPSNKKIIAPLSEKLVVIEGEPRQPVRNLHFENIAFAYTRWDMPKDGYMGIQAGHYAPSTSDPYRLLPGAIEWRYAVECGLRNCEIAHTGANGVVLGAGCQRNAIERCKFDDIGGNGVMVGWREGERKIGDAENENVSLAADWKNPLDAPAANQVVDNHLTRCGEQFWGCVGIFDAFSIHTYIAYNHVEAMPYTGISSGYRWDQTPTSQSGGIIEYNHIHDVMRRIADGGGIYTLGWQPHAVLRGNHIHDVHRSAYAHGGAPNNGVFFDQGSSGFLVEQNVIYETSGNPVRFNQCKAEWQQWMDNSFRTLPKDAGFPKEWIEKASPRYPVGIQVDSK